MAFKNSIQRLRPRKNEKDAKEICLFQTSLSNIWQIYIGAQMIK